MRSLFCTACIFIAGTSLRADSLVSSWHNQTITVWLARFDKDGYAEKIRALGTDKRVVVPSSVIAEFRGNIPRAQFPAVGLVIECTPPVKLKNGETADGRYTCQIEDGYAVSYRHDPETGTVSMDYRFGVYP